MSTRNTGFLVALNGQSPRTLKDAIRHLSSASLGFIESWLSGDVASAEETSHEAFGHLDYIAGELLRQRDVKRHLAATWAASPLKAALSVHVGWLLVEATAQDLELLQAQQRGVGEFPVGATPVSLNLEKALTKLKHRDTVAVNFVVALPRAHLLYSVTTGGMGQAVSVAEVDITELCNACKSASAHV